MTTAVFAAGPPPPTDPAGAADPAATAVAAVAARWPQLGVADLTEVLSWTRGQLTRPGGDPTRLTEHLLSGVDPAADPRVTLTLRMAADVPAVPSAAAGGSLAPDERPCFVSHEVIGRADLSDTAVQVWLVLGMHPQVGRGAGFPLAAWWIAERAGWTGSLGTVERRVQRATAELVTAGLLAVTREPIGGGHSRPVYRRLGEPGERGKEMVTRSDVRALRPALLRSYLRWRRVMGHPGRTRLSMAQLAQRWDLSVKQVRRQREDLVAAGLLAVVDGVTVDARRTRPDGLSTGAEGVAGGGTFLSASSGDPRDIFVGPKEKNYIPTDLHTPVGTNVPNVEKLSRADANCPTPVPDQPPVLRGRATQAPPTGPGISSDREEAAEAAGRIVMAVDWLRDAPQRVRWQARSLLIGQLRRLRHGVTADALLIALQTRVDPSDVGDRHCQRIRQVLAGLYADAIAVVTPTPRRPSLIKPVDARPTPPPPAPTVEGLRAQPLPPEPDWRGESVPEVIAYQWLIRFFAHVGLQSDQGAAALLVRVERQLPEAYQGLARAAADWVRRLPLAPSAQVVAGRPAGHPDPLAAAAWLAELLETPLTTEPDWTDPDPCAAWVLRHLADAATAPWQDPEADGSGDGTKPISHARAAALALWPRLQHTGQRAALRAALTQLTVALGVPDPDDLQLPDDLDPPEPEPDRLEADMIPTAEQQAAVEAFATGQNVVITAGAGTGKTSTLRLLADRADRRGLYVAFNKAIAEEARHSFPSTVQARTAHSLAYGWARRHCPATLDRMGGRTPWQRVAELVDVEPMRLATHTEPGRLFDQAAVTRWTMDMVRRYCQSSATELEVTHMPTVIGLDEATRRQVGEMLLPKAAPLWADMIAPAGSAAVGHETYLKLWGLSQPSLPGNYILFDEAQDASPVIAAVVLAQAAQLVFVGDQNQAIFGFTGAVDAMAAFDAPHRLALTQSWRFGQHVAYVANTALEALDAPLRLTGHPGVVSRVGPDDTARAVLCRTNTATIATVLDAHERRQAVHLLGGVQTAQRFVDGADQLIATGRSQHPDLIAFSSWDQAREYAEHDPRGQEVAALVGLVDDYGTRVLQQALERCVPTEAAAQVVVSTVHKAKGREWPSVRIDSDFDIEPALADVHHTDDSTRQQARAELMLAYVALTRCQVQLDPGTVADQLAEHHLDSVTDKLTDALNHLVNKAPACAPRPRPTGILMTDSATRAAASLASHLTASNLVGQDLGGAR